MFPCKRFCITLCVVFTTFLCTLPAAEGATKLPKVLYLTFDDGPSYIYTPEILNVLKKEHVKATFFVVGNRAKELPNIVKRTCREGHELGNHGYFHPAREYLSDAKQTSVTLSDIKKADMLLTQLCGHKPLYYRPPGGIIHEEEIKQLHALGYRIALWTVDSEDWKTPSTVHIIRNVTEHAKPGSVILFHDGVSNSRFTVQALPKIIGYYRNQGYSFRVLPVKVHL